MSHVINSLLHLRLLFEGPIEAHCNLRFLPWLRKEKRNNTRYVSLYSERQRLVVKSFLFISSSAISSSPRVSNFSVLSTPNGDLSQIRWRLQSSQNPRQAEVTSRFQNPLAGNPIPLCVLLSLFQSQFPTSL